MKKKMIALLAGAMMFAAMSGNAFAYFGTGNSNNFDLVRVVYDSTGTVEVGTDLGNINTISGTSSASSAFSLSQFGTGKTFANLNVAYFAIDQTTGTLWTTSTSVPAGMTKTNVLNAITAGQSISSYYNQLGGSTGTVVADQGNVNSFYSLFDKGGAATGSADAALNPATNELNLSALASTGFADMELYKFTGTGRTGTLTTTAAMVLRTNANGTTTINPVPIPPAFFLMGSGLLGMVGIRRRRV